MIGGLAVNKCVSCKVSVYPQHCNCPLCGKSFDASAQSETSYPQYIFNRDKYGFTINKLLLFISIVVCAISIFINAFTLDKNLAPWSEIVCASVITLWLIIRNAFEKRNGFGKKVLYVYGIVSLFLIVLDIYSGFYKWSTTYAVPFMTVAVAFIFTVMAVINRINYIEYLGVLIALFFVSFCPVIIFLFSLATQMWTSFIAILYCLLTIIGLIIFSGRSFKQELKKRFHF